nr:DNA cytosine methyltransferase [uncultured Roseateles sp.]
MRPDDFKGYTQCHFFAGIGGWPLALRLAGWPDDRAVWTGSCPCQPFSAAGKGAGFADERHLWPSFFHLITQRAPAVVFGEQVASKDGREWLGLVRADMEGMGYAVGAADLCAAGVGAPHIRQRLYWVADARSAGPQGGEQPGQRIDAQRAAVERGGEACGVADASDSGRDQGRGGAGEAWGYGSAGDDGPSARAAAAGPLAGFWRDADWLLCRDGRWRPVEPGTFPLAHGIPSRVGLLRGYGNAIVPQVAAAFIDAYVNSVIPYAP